MRDKRGRGRERETQRWGKRVPAVVCVKRKIGGDAIRGTNDSISLQSGLGECLAGNIMLCWLDAHETQLVHVISSFGLAKMLVIS